jgi:hypothetical protein
MKKLHYAFLLIAMSLISNYSFGQMPIDKGTSFINAGIGVGGYGYFNGSGVALSASYEAGVYKNITVGGIAGFRTYGSGVNSFDIGARGSYHFNELINLTDNKLDLYAGLGVSFYRLSYGDTYLRSIGVNDTYTTAYVPIHIGARYLFANNLGGFAEISSSLATLRLGVTFKLK